MKGRKSTPSEAWLGVLYPKGGVVGRTNRGLTSIYSSKWGENAPLKAQGNGWSALPKQLVLVGMRLDLLVDSPGKVDGPGEVSDRHETSHGPTGETRYGVQPSFPLGGTGGNKHFFSGINEGVGGVVRGDIEKGK